MLISVHLHNGVPLPDFTYFTSQKQFISQLRFLGMSAGNILGQVRPAIMVYLGARQLFKL